MGALKNFECDLIFLRHQQNKTSIKNKLLFIKDVPLNAYAFYPNFQLIYVRSGLLMREPPPVKDIPGRKVKLEFSIVYRISKEFTCTQLEKKRHC